MMKTNKERYNLERDTVMCSNPRAMFPMGSMNSCEMQQKDCGVLGGEDELGDCVCYSVDAKGNKELSYIEILPAYHGDAFIIHAFREEFSGIIVIDGGPDQSRIKVLRALEQLEKIDLMVLTHNDSDHISGLNTYLEQQTELDSNNVKELWVNCAREIDIRVGNIVSYSQASKLADMLRLLNEKKKGASFGKKESQQAINEILDLLLDNMR